MTKEGGNGMDRTMFVTTAGEEFTAPPACGGCPWLKRIAAGPDGLKIAAKVLYSESGNDNPKLQEALQVAEEVALAALRRMVEDCEGYTMPNCDTTVAPVIRWQLLIRQSAEPLSGLF